MIPRNITRDHVVRALQELDVTGVAAGRRSRRFALEYQGRHYPPKLVISIANRYANGVELSSTVFSGGDESNRFLEALGFVVREDQNVTSPRHGPLVPAPNSIGPKKHTGQHCPRCKEAVAQLLERVYGEVRLGHSLPLGTLPGQFTHTVHGDALATIFDRLRRHRGFADFVRSERLPPCDFFVPNPGFIVEFDESQHFTIPRQVALDKYPPSLQLGYDRARWSALCARIQAHDPDPPFRDEQRAWYDTLRDFAPAFLGLGPTVRLHAGARVWCDLDPDRREHLRLFRSLIEGRRGSWIIEVRDTPKARVARVILTCAWEGDLVKARELLDAISRSWPEDRRVDFLITCGGFIQFDLAPVISPLNAKQNPVRALELLLGETKRIAMGFLEGELIGRFDGKLRYITLGTDSHKDKISTSQTLITQPHAEMVALLNLKTGEIHCTAKSYPTPGQETGLLRSTDLLSHFIQSDDGSTIMILGCHDLSIFNPRGIANAMGWRAAMGSDFRSLAKKLRPRVVLQHPHTTEFVGTWTAAWNRLTSELPSVELYASAGRYWRPDGPRSALEDVLARTTSGPALDFIVSTHGV